MVKIFPPRPSQGEIKFKTYKSRRNRVWDSNKHNAEAKKEKTRILV